MLVLVIERSLASGYEGQQTVAAQKEGSTLWADPMSGCYIDLERGRGATLFQQLLQEGQYPQYVT